MKKKTFSGEKKNKGNSFGQFFWKRDLKEASMKKKVGEKKRSKFAMGVLKKDLRKGKLGYFILRRKIWKRKKYNWKFDLQLKI